MMKPLFIPWTLDRYLNGAHPLIVSVLDGLVGQIPMTGPQKWLADDESGFVRQWLRLTDEMQTLTGADRKTVERFISTRYHLSDMAAPSHSIGFHHTILPSLRHSNIVHFETPILFFWPEVNHGKFARGFSLVDHPFYPMIRASLAHPNIKKIVSHSLTGLRYLKSLFPDAVIHDKTACLPLMPFVQRYIERARQSPGGEACSPTAERCRILFTNSFHGYPNSFWLRGGVTTLLAFHRVREHIPLELIIVGTIPDDLPEEAEAVLRSPHVRHVPRASEGELQSYYDSAEVILVPSVGLHSMSIARAIGSGCYVICSDAPGVEDLVTDQSLGVIMNGTVRERVHFTDAKVGLVLDDYASVKQINYDNVEVVTGALRTRLNAVPHRDKPPMGSSNSGDQDFRHTVDLFREVCL